jgi:hypothetical protein
MKSASGNDYPLVAMTSLIVTRFNAAERLDEELPPSKMEKVEEAATTAVKNVREGLGKMVLNLKASTAKIGDMVKNTQAGAK